MYICLKLINYILIRQPAARPEDRAKVLMASDLVRRNVRSLRRRVKLVVAAPRVDAAWRHRSQRISDLRRQMHAGLAQLAICMYIHI